MGIDAGFDMVPPLSRGAEDQQKWQSFIEIIKERYKEDGSVEVKPNYIIFTAGEHPQLPFQGHKFLRFSSKISGSHAEGVGEYIEDVARLAKLHFGSRVKYWNEAFDQNGIHSWQEVNDSIRSYDQPDEPDIPTSIAHSALETDAITEPDELPFSIQSVPGKGKGLVARFDIAQGRRILCEKPLFTTPSLSPRSLFESIVATKVKALSKIEQRQFLSLHNNFPGKYPFSGIVRTNALPCGPDSTIGGVYPTICLINHSCLPNAQNSWNSDAEWETIHATRLIKSGEEITISYDKGGSSDARRTFLKDSFGFDCSCSLCSLPHAELQKSDARRLQIQLLDQAIGDATRVVNKPGDALADCRRLLHLLEEEYGATALIARLYYDAFQISITHGDQARASVFAERGYRSRIICEGQDSPETRNIKSLMENPATHRNFGASKRWRTAKKTVPKGLDTAEFEKWLWREGK